VYTPDSCVLRRVSSLLLLVYLLRPDSSMILAFFF